MSCFNSEETLPISIESILNQTYTNLELLIVDDGSTDNSIFKIKDLIEKQDIKIFKDGQTRFGAREWSPNIIKRLEDACDNKVLAPGFPADMTDDEPEEPGYEIIAKSWATDQKAMFQLATAQFQKPKTGKLQGR